MTSKAPRCDHPETLNAATITTIQRSDDEHAPAMHEVADDGLAGVVRLRHCRKVNTSSPHRGTSRVDRDGPTGTEGGHEQAAHRAAEDHADVGRRCRHRVGRLQVLLAVHDVGHEAGQRRVPEAVEDARTEAERASNGTVAVPVRKRTAGVMTTALRTTSVTAMTRARPNRSAMTPPIGSITTSGTACAASTRLSEVGVVPGSRGRRRRARSGRSRFRGC